MFGSFRQSSGNIRIDSGVCRDSKIDEFVGEENSLQVQNEDRVDQSAQVNDNSVVTEITKYEFLSGKYVSGFMEEPKNFVFSVQEFYVGGFCDHTDTHIGGILHTEEAFHQEKTEDSVKDFSMKQEEGTFSGVEGRVFTEYKFMQKYDASSKVDNLLEDRSLSVDSESETTDSDYACDSTESPEAKFEKAENIESMMDQAASVMRDQANYSDDDYYRELKFVSQNSSLLDEDMCSIQDLMEPHNKNEEEDFVHIETVPFDLSTRISEEPQLNQEEEDLVYEATNPVRGPVEFEESGFKHKVFNSYDDDDDDDDDFEFFKEHEDIVEQLRMELRNARTGGLATIMEDSESESCKMVEELKPLNIDKKWEHKDQMVEIHKFYKSYLNKMRKLDVLNSQTMHAIGKIINNPLSSLISPQISAS